MGKNGILAFLISVMIAQSCGQETISPGASQSPNPTPVDTSNPKLFPNGWSVNTDFVFDGGVGKDGIRSIDEPQYRTVQEVDYMAENDLVIIVHYEGKTKVFPIKILDYHEIVNTQISSLRITVSHCPLTGTSVVWRGAANGLNTDYGVSGLLYNNNLILYDRQTDTYWSQMKGQAIFGNYVCSNSEVLPMIETEWQTFRKMNLDDAEVLDINTGFGRNYSRYPYGDYKTNNSYILFPTRITDNTFNAKERVHLIVEENDSIQNAKILETVNSALIQNEGYVIIADPTLNLFISFESILNDGSEPEFSRSHQDLPALLEDSEGNTWNIFGEAISGPRVGESLTPTFSMMSYWFPIASVYDEFHIYD